MPPFRSAKCIRSTLFGFDNAHRQKAIKQLRELLKLNKDQFQDMKEKLQTVTQKHLDIDHIGSTQTEALDKALEDLQSQLPALFNTGNIEERLFYAMRSMLVFHTYRRKLRASHVQYPKRNQQNTKLSLTKRMAANLASIMDGARAPKIFASPAPAACEKVQSSSSSIVKIRSPLSEIPVSASGSLNARQRYSPPLLPQMPDSSANAKTPSSSILSRPEVQDLPSSLPRHESSHMDDHLDKSKIIKIKNRSFPTRPRSISSSNMIVSPTSCSNTPIHGGQIRTVHRFLEAAIPPMTHLSHRFIEFGCLNEEYLLAVSVWPLERIRTFLKNLPPGPGGSPLTKMEVDILTYHFESYFLTSNSKA